MKSRPFLCFTMEDKYLEDKIQAWLEECERFYEERWTPFYCEMMHYLELKNQYADIFKKES